jgi:hypothetical protein
MENCFHFFRQYIANQETSNVVGAQHTLHIWLVAEGQTTPFG